MFEMSSITEADVTIDKLIIIIDCYTIHFALKNNINIT